MAAPAVGATPWADIGFQQTYYTPLLWNQAARGFYNGVAIQGGGNATQSPQLLPNMAQDSLGTIRFQVDPTGVGGVRAYRLAQIQSGSAAVAVGSMVQMVDACGTVGDTRQSQSSRNSVLGFGIGVITPGNVGWVQVYGAHAALITASTSAIGDFLIPSGTDQTVATVAQGTAPTYRVLAISTAVVSSGTVQPAFIHLL
jgi:hypothetical protein